MKEIAVLVLLLAVVPGISFTEKKGGATLKDIAEQGNAEAQSVLCGNYYLGTGMPKNYREAAKWCRKAAEQGNGDAQVTLGFMYFNGHGVPKDYVKAYAWGSLAVSQAAKNVVKAGRYDPEKEASLQARLAQSFQPSGSPQGDIGAGLARIFIQRDLKKQRKKRKIMETYQVWSGLLSNLENQMTAEQVDRAQTLAAEYLEKQKYVRHPPK